MNESSPRKKTIMGKWAHKNLISIIKFNLSQNENAVISKSFLPLDDNTANNNSKTIENFIF